MCGIAGFLKQELSRDEWTSVLSRMSAAIAHRGPDDHGIWFDEVAGVGFAHQRLSVLDPSPEGHQPMTSHNGRYVLIYNGEIYNFKKIKKELEESGNTYPWRGHSDTEIILAAFTAWGIVATLKRMIGMFAFALWDRQERVLTLARDRIGEKPLYYGWQGKTFIFGSELKAFKALPEFRKEINRDALALFLQHNYIPTPFSIYKGIAKLRAGTFTQVSTKINTGVAPCEHPYWQLKNVVKKGRLNPYSGTGHDAVVDLDRLLRSTIQDKMVADVPLGAFLSGGVDSSTVVALMQAVSNQSVRTFSIGFSEKNYNEATYAKSVARHLSTNHTELYVTPQHAINVIPQLPILYDEPFADSSQIPTFLVSKMTKQHVTVALSGDGGDELFGGYNRYFLGRAIWNKMSSIPLKLRKSLAHFLFYFSPRQWNLIFSILEPFLGKNSQLLSGDRVHKLASILEATSSPEDMYHNLVTHWPNPELLARGSKVQPTILSE